MRRLLAGRGALFVERLDAKRSAGDVDHMATALIRGQAIAVFPESWFDREAGLKPLHAGAFLAAAKTGVPVIVSALRWTRHLAWDATVRLRDGAHRRCRCCAAGSPGPFSMPHHELADEPAAQADSSSAPIGNGLSRVVSTDMNPIAGFVLTVKSRRWKTKDPQLSELAGLMNVKEFSLTIVLAEAVGFEPTIQV